MTKKPPFLVPAELIAEPQQQLFDPSIRHFRFSEKIANCYPHLFRQDLQGEYCHISYF